MLFRFRPLAVMLAVGAALVLIANSVDARPNSGGSRGSRTFSAPPPTATTPGTARPIERTMTQPGQPPPPSPVLRQPRRQLAASSIVQVWDARRSCSPASSVPACSACCSAAASAAGLAALHRCSAWCCRSASSSSSATCCGPGGSGAAGRKRRSPAGLRCARPRRTGGSRWGLAALGGGVGGGLGGGRPPFADRQELQLTEEDFNTFERLLGEIQTAYGAEDLAALRARLTPEMLSYFSEDLSQTASRGHSNQNLRREAAAGRSVGSLARARRGIRNGRDALLAQRQADRTGERQGGRRRSAERSPSCGRSGARRAARGSSRRSRRRT